MRMSGHRTRAVFETGSLGARRSEVVDTLRTPPFGVQKHQSPTVASTGGASGFRELRGQDLNLRPSGYEPDELPGCSTPRRCGRLL